MATIEIKKTVKLVDYETSIKFMELRVEEIKNKKQNELVWFLNHNHVYTQGTSSSKSEIIEKNHVNIIRTNRGGKTTYHGPGQRIVYFLINLNSRRKDIRKFISIIEDSLIEFLLEYNVEAKSFKDRVGIWVTRTNKIKFEKERKIGAIGLRISKWVTYHGLSFNINPDLKYYDSIHSCGLKNYKNTSLEELGINITNNQFDKRYQKIFLRNLKTF